MLSGNFSFFANTSCVVVTWFAKLRDDNGATYQTQTSDTARSGDITLHKYLAYYPRSKAAGSCSPKHLSLEIRL